MARLELVIASQTLPLITVEPGRTRPMSQPATRYQRPALSLCAVSAAEVLRNAQMWPI